MATKKEFETNPELYKLMKQVEVKRVNENLTKRELTDLIDVHYMFYYNCVIGTNNPSQGMQDAVKVYLDMPTKDVYESLFARRSSNFTSANKKRNKKGIELFHDKMKFGRGEANSILEELKSHEKFTEPKDHLSN